MSASQQIDEIAVLKLSLHQRRVGYLVGFRSGRNVLSFADDFRHDPNRPTLSLITHPMFPNVDKIMAEPWVKHQRLHPVLSNLLPEGVLRELIAQRFKIHADHEFQMLAHLGHDLPGALVASPMKPEDIPDSVLATHRKTRATTIATSNNLDGKFSLAGVQMKFSMKATGSHYKLTRRDDSGDWIIKPPSPTHAFVPLNEFTAMTLAGMAGAQIPPIALIELQKLHGLPPIKLPDEKLAFGIKRFDRDGSRRIHTEDFAQVLIKYPHRKYDSASYEQIGRVIHNYLGDGLADTQQFARRLLINILLANGDAHLKNWSLHYPDQITPRLAPAYDIVTTSVYIEDETQFALNLSKTKVWYRVTLDHFRSWSEKAGIPWRAIKPHLDDTMDKARTLWPGALKELPMHDSHKQHLRQHWGRLQKDFRIQSS